MKTITFTGLDAVRVSLETHLLPEVLLLPENAWKHSGSIPFARGIASSEPDRVRLMTDARILLENLTKAALPVDVDVLALARRVAATAPSETLTQLIQKLEQSP